MVNTPRFLDKYPNTDYIIEESESYKVKHDIIDGSSISNFTVTKEPVIRVIFPIINTKERRKTRSCYYINVTCSCSNNLWVKVSYFLKGEYKCCENCRAKVREGKFRDLQDMRIWHTRCYEIKKSAKKQNIPFNLTPEYLKNIMVEQNNICGITGEKLLEYKGNISLDKKDPKLGYIIGNVQWTNRKSNMMKQDLSMKELVEWCKKVVNKWETL